MLSVPNSKLQVTIVREIAANPARIFEAVISPQGMVLWAPRCHTAEWIHPAGSTEPDVGSVRQLVLSGNTVLRERIVAWKQNSELHYAIEGPAPVISPLTRNYIGVTRVEALGQNASRLTWQLHFDTPGLRLAAAPPLKLLMRWMIAGMADRIAEIAQK